MSRLYPSVSGRHPARWHRATPRRSEEKKASEKTQDRTGWVWLRDKHISYIILTLYNIIYICIYVYIYVFYIYTYITLPYITLHYILHITYIRWSPLFSDGHKILVVHMVCGKGLCAIWLYVKAALDGTKSAGLVDFLAMKKFRVTYHMISTTSYCAAMYIYYQLLV